MTLAIKYFKFSVIYVVVFIIKADQEPTKAKANDISQTDALIRQNITNPEQSRIIEEEAVDIDEEIEWTSNKSVSWIYGYLRSLSKHYPKTTRMVEIGVSPENNPIYAFEILQGIYFGATIIVDAGMDGADQISVDFAIYILHQLIQNVEQNLWVLAGVKIVIIPLVNPDKYHAYLQRIDTTCQETLYKNFEIGDRPKKGECRSPAFFTEPETKALRFYYLNTKPFKLYINLNKGSPIIATPFAYKMEDVPGILKMAENVKDAIEGNYSHLSEMIEVNSLHKILGYMTSGSPVDWVYEVVRVPYSLYMALDKSPEDPQRTLVAYFQGFRYAVLQLQLTDPDIAIAILDECSGKDIIYTKIILISILTYVLY